MFLDVKLIGNERIAWLIYLHTLAFTLGLLLFSTKFNMDDFWQPCALVLHVSQFTIHGGTNSKRLLKSSWNGKSSKKKFMNLMANSLKVQELWTTWSSTKNGQFNNFGTCSQFIKWSQPKFSKFKKSSWTLKEDYELHELFLQ